MSIASWTSPPASASTFPISWLMRSVSSALCSVRSCAKRKMISPRRGAGTRRQLSKAAFAASTARSTSSGPDLGKAPIVLPFAGFVLSKVSPEAASTHSPSMKFLYVLVPKSVMWLSLVAAVPRSNQPTTRNERALETALSPASFWTLRRTE